MIHSGLSSLVAAVVFLSLSQADAGDARFPVPSYDRAGHFEVSDNLHPATYLTHGLLNFVVFDEALKNCGLSQARLTQTLKDVDASLIITQLGRVFHHVSDQLAADRFFIFIGQHPTKPMFHSAFFIQTDAYAGDAAISMDCSLFLDDAWQSALAHELVHMLMRKQNRPAWWQEMAAQWVESQMLRDFPREFAKPLQTAQTIPSPFLEVKKGQVPFAHDEEYAANFLFIHYLQTKWGNAYTMRAFDLNFQIGNCALTQSAVKLFFCRWKELKFMGESDQGRFTPDTILQFFALALLINRGADANEFLFEVPSWEGFQEVRGFEWLSAKHLQAGSITRLKNSRGLEKLLKDPGYTVIRGIIKGPYYLILYGDEIYQTTPSDLNPITRDEILVLKNL